MTNSTDSKHRRLRQKPSLRWTAILFAFAANMLLTTTSDLLVGRLDIKIEAEVLATMVAPFAAGLLTALYAKERGGMHAFIGGMLSVPALAVVVFPGNWQFAFLSGLFCTLGGALTEIITRPRNS